MAAKQTASVTIEEAECLTCPGPLAADCDISQIPPYEDVDDFEDGGGSATFPCTVNRFLKLISEISDGNTCPETVTRIYQITDACGNVQTCNQEIVLNDEENPVLICPPDILNSSTTGDVQPPIHLSGNLK